MIGHLYIMWSQKCRFPYYQISGFLTPIFQRNINLSNFTRSVCLFFMLIRCEDVIHKFNGKNLWSATWRSNYFFQVVQILRYMDVKLFITSFQVFAPERRTFNDFESVGLTPHGLPLIQTFLIPTSDSPCCMYIRLFPADFSPGCLP